MEEMAYQCELMNPTVFLKPSLKRMFYIFNILSDLASLRDIIVNDTG
jgi:hypothetical protein